MKTEIAEIADRIYRLSTFVPRAGSNGLTFNQFLIDSEQPLLFHYGQRSLFALISAAVKEVMPVERLRWHTSKVVEADEASALNEWLAVEQQATPTHEQVGCNNWH